MAEVTYLNPNHNPSTSPSPSPIANFVPNCHPNPNPNLNLIPSPVHFSETFVLEKSYTSNPNRNPNPNPISNPNPQVTPIANALSPKPPSVLVTLTLVNVFCIKF